MNLRPQTWALAAVLGLLLFVPSVAQAEDLPQTIADRLYRSYMQSKGDRDLILAERKADLTPELYQQLVQAFQKTPQDGAWLDVDPFSGNQMGISSYTVDTVKLWNKRLAHVYVTIKVPRGNERVPILVILEKSQNRWQIGDLVYFNGHDLMCDLREVNRAQR